jgi:heterotetrameric sarcosine oxidase gamma subunit
MLDVRSPLERVKPYRSDALKIFEAPHFSLTQAAGFDKRFEKTITPIVGKLPTKIGTALESEGRTIFRTGPLQFWFTGPENDDLATKLSPLCIVTPLSHSRTRIALEGKPARDVLAKGIALDFHETTFTSGMFAMTGLHHTPVLVHCVSQDRIDLYAMRTFAVTVWDWLTDAALEYAS